MILSGARTVNLVEGCPTQASGQLLYWTHTTDGAWDGKGVSMSQHDVLQDEMKMNFSEDDSHFLEVAGKGQTRRST